MKPCKFCDTEVNCPDLIGPSATLAVCVECAQRIDNEELERVQVSLGHMKYILYCAEHSDVHPEVFGRRIDIHA